MTRRYENLEDKFEIKCRACSSTDVELTADFCEKCGSFIIDARCNSCESKYIDHDFKIIEEA